MVSTSSVQREEEKKHVVKSYKKKMQFGETKKIRKRIELRSIEVNKCTVHLMKHLSFES